MNFYKLILAYDGTNYSGWQCQKHCLAVSNSLQDTFKKVLNKKVKIIGASRTDAGVHALGQVAKVELDLDIEPEKLKNIINNKLPTDILIREIESVSEDFHPQASVELKTYYYHFFTQRPLPTVSRYGYYFYKPIDIEKLKSCFKIFIGTHDFRSFCTGHEAESTVRTISSIKLYYFKRFNIYRIEIKGPAFLRYMIRRIVGAMLDIASSNYKTADDLVKVLQEKNPQQHYKTAPANGLMLYKIKYKSDL